MHRKSIPNQASFEFLFQSVPVSNQTYKAQVKLYFIVRRIGANRIENEKAAADTMSSIQIDLEEKNYVVEAFDKISDYESFAHSLEKANCSRVLSVSKKEKAVPNALSANGLMYYNEVVDPSENINTAAITNALTQYPNSVISLQIIPTKYSVQEIYYWLTCVLISSMAWKNNDRELSDRALARAVRLDKKDSAIFYMLFNLRMGRDEAALKWFYTYQECDLKGSDQTAISVGIRSWAMPPRLETA